MPTETPLPTPIGGGAGQVAFASTLEGLPQIYVIDSDGKGRRKITNLPEGACQPDWSPDGQRLVFISPCTNNNDYYPRAAMYIINQDGKGLLPLPTLSGGDYDPKWSPDGKYILFTSLRNSLRPQLYVLNLEDNSVRSLSEKYLTDFQGSWSPDGKEVIFISTRRTTQEIWIVGADGSDARQFQVNNSFISSHPAFSPDGKNIIYTQYIAEGSIPRVNISPAVSEQPTEFRVSVSDMPMRDAVYSPDSYWLAFEGWQIGGSHNIYIIAANGAGLTALTDDAMMDFDPDWRPTP
jgi:Tol biopolymer transport system component